MNKEIGSRRLVDPELAPMIEAMPSTDFSLEALPAIREGMYAAFSAMAVELPISPVELEIAGPDGPASIFWYDPYPEAKNRPALLHIHGGGMILGSASKIQLVPSQYAAALGLPVASVDYRLAPETTFPGPQEDCYAALLWLVNNATELGVDPLRIGVIGESSGGGLAAAVAQIARDRAMVKLAAQILIYPMLDYRVGGEADPWKNQHTGEFVWTRDNNQFGWEALRGGYRFDDKYKGWFSPSLADTLSGLAPAWIGVGSLDLFFDENLDYARRLADAGVPVELHGYSGAPHGFDLAFETTVARRFRRDLLDGVGRLLGLPPRPA